MNKNLQRLVEIAEKETRLIIGLMSGTSLDGLDIALCAITGHGMQTKVELLHFKTASYAADIKENIREVFAKQQISFQSLCLLNPWIAKIHAALILEALQEWNIQPATIDVIASHGQTVYHAPKILHRLEKFPNATLQIGDGDHIAVDTGIITLSDFRQKHIAAGGEGAPLALYGDYYIFSAENEKRILLNMGGIANFTYLGGKQSNADIFVTDTGPGNTLIDAVAKQYFHVDFDENSQLATKGKVHAGLLTAFKADDFFNKPFPKTTGPELFNLKYVQQAQQRSATEDIDSYDLIATITQLSADTIVDAISSLIKQGEAYTIYISGGGAHNPLLVNLIAEGLPGIPLKRTDDIGIPGDAKEAILFAVLANETLAGNAASWPGKEGMPSVTMGKISFPD